MTTADALTEWLELSQDIAVRWGELLENAWLDLPPDVCEAVLDASEAFAVANVLMREHLETTTLEYDFDAE